MTDVAAAASAAAFDYFATDAVLPSGAVRVIVDRGIQIEDEDGGVSRVDFLVHMPAAAVWSRGELLTDTPFGTLKLGAKVQDDGFIVKVSAVSFVQALDYLLSAAGDYLTFADGARVLHANAP